jgi:predicted nuclease of predicted toxin-antitoxin system
MWKQLSEPNSRSRPKLLIDQSLGSLAVPAFFRQAGFDTTTIAELFGRTDVPDVEWIQQAGKLGMVVVNKDARIRYRPAERQAVIQARLRLLCLTSGNLRTAEQVECFRTNLKAIERFWGKPGPWILAVRRQSVQLLNLD